MTVNRRAGCMLLLLALIYMIGELGHFLIGVVSRAAAQDIHYGDLACFPKPNLGDLTADFKFCEDGETVEQCQNLTVGREEDDISVCKWDYSGLGLEYQILAGPSFIFLFTLTGIFWGLMADRFNRLWLLSTAALIFSLAMIGASFATKYWHLILSRMFLAAGESACSPLAAGMISDMFPRKQNAFAMGLFNWGIYTGYGLSYAIGTYITAANILDQGWRAAFFISGIPGIFLSVILFVTMADPPKTMRSQAPLGESNHATCNSDKDLSMPEDESQHFTGADKQQHDHVNSKEMPSLVKLFFNPVILLLGFAACIRHSAGLAWGYNSALYFQKYYPDYSDAGWWLMGISIGGGATGSAIGGYVSDRLVRNFGVSARALVLAASQFLATPFSLGLLYLNPPYSFFSLLVGYLFAEMWFGVMFAIFMELLPSSVRSTALAIALFVINNFGGNIPVLVNPVSSVTSYRTAITIFYSGSLFTSSLLFFTLYVILRRKKL